MRFGKCYSLLLPLNNSFCNNYLQQKTQCTNWSVFWLHLNYCYSFIFRSAGRAFHIVSWSKCCLCVCQYACLDVIVNQGGTDRNRCKQRLVILHARPTNEPCSHVKTLRVLYGSKSPAEKCGSEHRHFQAS